MHPSLLLSAILVFPFFSFLLLGILGKHYFNKSAGGIATFFMFSSTVAALLLSYQYFSKSVSSFLPVSLLKYPWLTFYGNLTIDMGCTIDSISAMMIVVVSFVSLMVHIFSISYMKGSERFSIYFSYLGLFTFSMLGLVLASNLFQIYIFWELVGLSSFLLIGFYYQRPSAITAAKKAFIVTRFADLGFLLGILLLTTQAETLDIQNLLTILNNTETNNASIDAGSSFLGISGLTWALALIFIGAAGKSALFPLHIWLPDAMEGPTPVSALIHAATMVVAGVYLIAKLFPLYFYSGPNILEMITWVGVLSSVLAAVLACIQSDIKRVLAYSTMSQIGFMFCGMGVTTSSELIGFTASLFHLFTHAIFKALLFLSVGAIIHAVHTNEIKKMGGLRKSMPFIHIVFLIGCLSIAGIPPFAGFFSKEWILLAAYQTNLAVYWILFLTSGITAFYMFRLYFMVFWNKNNQDIRGYTHGNVYEHIPLLFLTIGTLIIGFVPFGHFVSLNSTLKSPEIHLSFAALPILLSVFGIVISAALYLKENSIIKWSVPINSVFMRVLQHKFYIDQLYLFITHKIIFKIIGNALLLFDKHVIENLSFQGGNATVLLSNKIKSVQSGKIQEYAIWTLIGILLLFLVYIYLRN